MAYLSNLGLLLGVILIAMFILLSVDFIQIGKVTNKPLQKRPHINYSVIPTIFVHGYRGNRYSFGHMLRRFERGNYAKKSAIVKLFADGSFTYKGQLLPVTANNPCLQILFKKNTASVWQQTHWLYGLMQYLKANGVDKVNLVGHSMGAVTVVTYCTRYRNRDNVPLVQNVVTLAGPFNDYELGKDTPQIFSLPLSATGPSAETPIYQYLRATVDEIKQPIHFLNIIGNILPTTRIQHDGSVSSDSSLALGFILRGTKHSYLQAVMRGAGAAHSLLHENSLVDLNIIDFLWTDKYHSFKN